MGDTTLETLLLKESLEQHDYDLLDALLAIVMVGFLVVPTRMLSKPG